VLQHTITRHKETHIQSEQDLLEAPLAEEFQAGLGNSDQGMDASTLSSSLTVQDFVSEASVQANILEKRYRIAGSRAYRGTQDAM
jgi:hypothetical protein